MSYYLAPLLAQAILIIAAFEIIRLLNTIKESVRQSKEAKSKEGITKSLDETAAQFISIFQSSLFVLILLTCLGGLAISAEMVNANNDGALDNVVSLLNGMLTIALFFIIPFFSIIIVGFFIYAFGKLAAYLTSYAKN